MLSSSLLPLNFVKLLVFKCTGSHRIHVWYMFYLQFGWIFYDLNVPGTQMTPIFEGQPTKTMPFPIKTRVIWVPGR